MNPSVAKKSPEREIPDESQGFHKGFLCSKTCRKGSRAIGTRVAIQDFMLMKDPSDEFSDLQTAFKAWKRNKVTADAHRNSLGQD